MALITNRDLIQPYVFSTAKYDFSVYEKRIIYRIVEFFQYLTEGKKLNKKYHMEENLWGDKKITMPVSCFLKDEYDKNYCQIKKALKALEDKVFEYEDEDYWRTIRIIYKPKIDKRGETATFELIPEIYEAFLNFAKGYRKYELKVAMQFKSLYAMRMYELISGKTDKIEYELKTIREMFGITNKYKTVKNLRTRVFGVAQKELDEKSPYTFTYKLENRRAGKTYTHIIFYPVFQPEHRDEELETKRLQQLSHASGWMIDARIKDYLKTNFDFTTRELDNNIELIKKVSEAKNLGEFIDELENLKPRALRAETPKGYIIGALKKIAAQEKSTIHVNKEQQQDIQRAIGGLAEKMSVK